MERISKPMENGEGEVEILFLVYISEKKEMKREEENKKKKNRIQN